MVDEQGKFEIKDVPFGEYEAAVKQVLDPHEPGHIPFDKRIPRKYRSGGTSGIAVSIQSEDEVVIAIEME